MVEWFKAFILHSYYIYYYIIVLYPLLLVTKMVSYGNKKDDILKSEGNSDMVFEKAIMDEEARGWVDRMGGLGNSCRLFLVGMASKAIRIPLSQLAS